MNKVAQQVETFRKLARGAILEETLVQRTKTPSFAADYATHEVVSAYAFGNLPESSSVLHEIRKVISVDGRQVTSAAKARQAMTLGLQSADDKLKKRLLEDFEHHGLTGAVTDLGQVLLLFSASHSGDYKVEIAGERLFGADLAVVMKFEQVSGSGGVTVFRNNKGQRQSLNGELLVRKTDGLLLRISTTATQASQRGKIEDELSVDYAESPLGCLLPVAVEYREYLENVLLSENVFRYTSFRLSGASR